MNIGERLQQLRKSKGLTQEELADYLGVSRQSVSKWELDLAYPETDKLIRLAKYYHVTLDSFIYPEGNVVINPSNKSYYEYKSNRSLFGLPLIHINVGKGKRISKGIISIGNVSTGIVSLGILSFGVVSLGLIGGGLFTLGVVAIALLLAVGAFAVGTISIGSIALGILAVGSISIGYFSVGALSVGKYVAIGDRAYGLVAVGKSFAQGTYHYLYPINKQEVLNKIDSVVPSQWALFIKIIKWVLNILN